jgi:hypothetical protein
MYLLACSAICWETFSQTTHGMQVVSLGFTKFIEEYKTSTEFKENGLTNL